jgi:hypothetical protein
MLTPRPSLLRPLGAALILLGVLAAAGGCSSDGGDSGQPDTTATASGTPSPAAPGTVTVEVTGVECADGGGLAGLLYRRDTVTDPDANVIGGFGVAVTGDPFSTSQVVRQPGPDFVGTFPFVTDQPLIVKAGTYAVMLWVSDEKLRPYSRWVPASTITASCWTTVTVEEGQAATVTVTSVPKDEGLNRCPTG